MVTRIHAAGELLEHFHVLGVQWQAVTPPPASELLIIAIGTKGRDRKLVTRDEDERVTYRFNEAVVRVVEHAEGPAPDRCLRPVSGLTDDGEASVSTVKRRPAQRGKRKPRVIVEACEGVLT